MTEDAAATVWHAMQLGNLQPMTQQDISRLHEHYMSDYGQQAV